MKNRWWFLVPIGAVGLLTVAFIRRGEAVPAPVPAVPALLQIEKVTSIAEPTHYPQRPVWSPDGKWIAFSRAKSDGIEVVRANGSDRKVLTTEMGSGYKFAWSPDSKEIAYRVNGATTGLYQIKKVTVSSGETTWIGESKEELHPPQWVHSKTKGKKISYVSVTGKNGGSSWEKLDAASNATAANTEKLLYFEQDNIWMFNEETGERKQVTKGVCFDPVWSPDRTQILYQNLDTMMVMDANGENHRELGYGIHGAWSPDGKKIVYQVTQDHTHELTDPRLHTSEVTYHKHDDKTNHQIVESDLFVMNADGTQKTKLTLTKEIMESDPSWSPDGKKIVYRLENTGEIQVLEFKAN